MTAERTGDDHLARETIALRRDLHAHPELGFQEVRTAGVVAQLLRESGIAVTEGVGGTGVVGTIRGRRPGGAIGLRADMDALSIHEQTGVAHASRTEGVMHACGHDGHTAVLVAAARTLAASPDFAGTVQVIFQPAEEGLGGAAAMLEDGLFERFPCDSVYALHTAPGLPVGVIATASGPLMAAGGLFEVTFSGAGGHGGQGAHLAADLTVAQASYVLALQSVVARDVPALETAVISVGYINGGSAQSPNVMPAELSLGGTVRCFSRDTQTLVGRRLDELAQSLAAAYRCTASVELTWVSPPLVNPPEQAGIVVRAATAALGDSSVHGDMPAVTGGEDFAFMMERKPGALVFLGNDAADLAAVHNVHTPHYDFNDDAIPVGVAYWTKLVYQQLGSG